ncbi:MAG: hypothetical protein KIG68_01325 [Oxalobacter sp.]|nr:hypothetical protein [Oxalobacter sp.]
MKKYIALGLLVLGIVSMAGCRHHHRPDHHGGPDYRHDRGRHGPQSNDRYDGNRGSQHGDRSDDQHGHGGPGNR